MARDNSAEGAPYTGGGNATLHSVQLALGTHSLHYVLRHCDLFVQHFVFGKVTHCAVCATCQRELFMLVKECKRCDKTFCSVQVALGTHLLRSVLHHCDLSFHHFAFG